MGQFNNRRRRIIIDKKLQSRIVLAVSWPAAACLALTAILLGYFCARVTQQALEADVVLEGVVPLFVTALGFLLVSTGFFLFNTLRISHKIAGPMYRVGKTMEAVKNGETNARAHLRDGDFLEQVASELNSFLDWVEPQLTGAAPAPAKTEAPARAGSENDGNAAAQDNAESGEVVAAGSAGDS